MIKLGQTGKDLITGFTGLCMGKAQYLTGCNQVLLTPTKLSKEGKRPDGEWFDEQRVKVVGAKTIELEDTEEHPGLDEPQAPRR